ncbi:uncharacterized protein LOC114311931 [Camellia sinensis]|uniref:uncharacterized protein LOC114311931 n=1 Tax=Camellia sinensis TaxID=4442 RepID=UPI001036968E|nr:uncharacterized protein LOC114311931 [Camellia sinensis]
MEEEKEETRRSQMQMQWIHLMPSNSSLITSPSAPSPASTTHPPLKTKYCLGDAIRLLYEKNVFGAPIVDDLHTDMDRDPDTTSHKLLDHYIGFVDFARMLLWSLEVTLS